MTRFGVAGRDEDRALIRALARRFAQDNPEAARLRAQIEHDVAGAPPRRGGILAALRRSPLVGADWEVKRDLAPGRDVDL